MPATININYLTIASYMLQSVSYTVQNKFHKMSATVTTKKC